MVHSRQLVIQLSGMQKPNQMNYLAYTNYDSLDNILASVIIKKKLLIGDNLND